MIAIIVIGGMGLFLYSNNSNKSDLANNEKSATQTYYNPVRGIKFQHPSTWKVDSQIVDGPNPIIAKFDRDSDTSLMLLHEANTNNINFDEYKRTSLDELKFAPGYLLVSEETKTANAVQTYQVTAKFEKGVQSRSIHFMSPDNSKLFTLVYRSTEGKFSQYLNELESILGTIEVK